jgi:hypothetical protein
MYAILLGNAATLLIEATSQPAYTARRTTRMRPAMNSVAPLLPVV